MRAETWIPILVGTVILGTLGWLAANQFGMNGTLSAINERTLNTSKRVDKISDYLPDYMARGEINKEIEGAIVTGKPYTNIDGEQLIAISIIDFKRSELHDYNINLGTVNYQNFDYLLKGAVLTNEEFPISLMKMSHYAQEQGMGTTLPNEFNLESSYLLRNTNYTDYEMILKAYDSIPTIVKFEEQASNWSEFSKIMLENQELIIKEK